MLFIPKNICKTYIVQVANAEKLQAIQCNLLTVFNIDEVGEILEICYDYAYSTVVSNITVAIHKVSTIYEKRCAGLTWKEIKGELNL